jgi:hypothetical protein
MDLGSTQSLTETSTRNLPGGDGEVKSGRRVGLTTSKTYGPPQPLTGAAGCNTYNTYYTTVITMFLRV